MLNIEKITEGQKATVLPKGRLDTVTAPEMEQALGEIMPAVSELVLDLEGLEYISSAGLRVLLSAQKTMTGKGGMTVKNVNDTVMEIFEVTGFTDILTIE